MIKITNSNELNKLSEENKFLGELPEFENSQIIIKGTGNVLVCKSSVKLVNCTLIFNGNNSLIYLCESRHAYHMTVSLYNNSVLYIGKSNFMNGAYKPTINITISEHTHCFIGNDCMISFDIWMRTADPHLIYSCSTNERLNLSKSIYIGDHVWIGQSVMMLKGTEIDSGSIIAANSLVAGKNIHHNEIWGGNPSSKIKESIFWERSCVHGWDEDDTQNSLKFSSIAEKKHLPMEVYKFEYDERVCISYKEIEEKLSSKDIKNKIDYLDYITSIDEKNRFVHY